MGWYVAEDSVKYGWEGVVFFGVQWWKWREEEFRREQREKRE